MITYSYKMLEEGIDINKNYPDYIQPTSKIKNKKLHKRIWKENTIFIWIESTYGVKPIEFEI